MADQHSYTSLDASGFSEALRDKTFDPDALMRWAQRYHGYERLGTGLPKVLGPLVEEIDATGKIPVWAARRRRYALH